jgi:hypothetical protein
MRQYWLRNKSGMMLLEIIVALTISAIILGSISGVLPSIMMKNKKISDLNSDKKKEMMQYMMVMKDFRNADLRSRIGNSGIKLILNDKTVEYRNGDGQVIRSKNGVEEKLLFKKITLFGCRSLRDCQEWESRDRSGWIKNTTWWKVDLETKRITMSGVVKGL